MSVSSAKASRAAFLYNSRQNVNRVTNISGPVPKKYRHLSKRLGTTVGTKLGNRLGPDLGLPFLLDLQILGGPRERSHGENHPGACGKSSAIDA